jgi:hypothetical protein
VARRVVRSAETAKGAGDTCETVRFEAALSADQVAIAASGRAVTRATVAHVDEATELVNAIRLLALEAGK